MNKQTTDVDYIFCILGHNFSNNFLNSWSETLVMLEKDLKASYIWRIHYEALVASTRNTLIAGLGEDNPYIEEKEGLIYKTPFLGKYKCKKVIFLDDDMVWTWEDMKRLLVTPHNILSGFYINRHNGVVGHGINNKAVTLNQIKTEPFPFEIHFCGFGFVSIDYEVFKNMSYPWFESGHNLEPEAIFDLIGEDYYFCSKARSLGYKIMGDPAIRLGHEKKHIMRIM